MYHSPTPKLFFTQRLHKQAVAVLGCVLMLLGVSSCQKDDDMMVASLSHNAGEELTLGSEASETEVLVTTNQPDWNYASTADWLHVEKLTDRLIISAEENVGAEERNSRIILTAGGILETLKVTQAGKGIVFSLEETELKFPYWGQEVTLHVASNASGWNVGSISESWVTVVADDKMERLTIKVEDNTGADPRTAELVLVTDDGGLQKSITISQEGKSEYFLPFFEWGANINVVQAKEEQRGHRLIHVPSDGSSAAGLTGSTPYYEFETKSSVFPLIRYETMDYGPNFLYKATVVVESQEVFRSDAFKAFMHANGFKSYSGYRMSSGDRVMYKNEDNSVHALAYVKNNKTELIFMPNPKQPSPAKTLDRIYFLNDGLTLDRSTLKEVVDSENAKGFATDTLWNAELSAQMGIPMRVFHDASPMYARWYYFWTSETANEEDAVLSEARFVFDRLDYGIYQFGNLVLLTDEFKALVKEYGFEAQDALMDPTSFQYFFDNKEKNVRLVAQRASWNGKKVFCYHLIPR